MKLALHRSISFWCGLLVVGFILFTWWASQSAMALVEAGSMRVVCWCGGASLIHNDMPVSRPACRMGTFNRNWARVVPAPFFVRGKEQQATKEIGEAFKAGSLPEYAETIYTSHSKSQWMLFIPHWMILPAAMAAWIGMIVWRARRRRRGTHADELMAPT